MSAVCISCSGSGLIGIPGAPCPFCKMPAASEEKWEFVDQAMLDEYDALAASEPSADAAAQDAS